MFLKALPTPAKHSTIRTAMMLGVTILAINVIAGCTKNPATGGSDFTPFMSPKDERAVGAREHPKILKQFGGALDDADLGAYVAQLGARLAAASELAGTAFVFTVLDSDTINAFALPGGYIYVTRGLIALANDEAELAGVLAHEIGHVTARHSAKRYHRSLGTGLLSSILGIATGSAGLARIGGLLGKGLVASYSRDQEYEADQLGIRYLSRIGLPPQAQGRFLESLLRTEKLAAKLSGKKASSNSSSFFASHPNTARRVSQARDAAQAANRAVIAAGRTPGADNGRMRYLRMIKGLPYGGSRQQGFVQGRRFIHPRLGFAFTVPRGYKLHNLPHAVIATASTGDALRFDRAVKPRYDDPFAYLTLQWAAKINLHGARRLFTNSLPVGTGHAILKGKKGSVQVHLAVIQLRSRQFYRLILQDKSGAGAAALDQVIGSFRRLNAAERLSLWPPVISLHSVRPKDSLQSLARRMRVDNHHLERFLVLNGLEPGQRPATGTIVKIVRDRSK